MSATPHPNDGLLVAFTEGRLPEIEIDAVATHLETCTWCQGRIEVIEEHDISIVIQLRNGDGILDKLPDECAERLLSAWRPDRGDPDSDRDHDPGGQAAERAQERLRSAPRKGSGVFFSFGGEGVVGSQASRLHCRRDACEPTEKDSRPSSSPAQTHSSVPAETERGNRLDSETNPASSEPLEDSSTNQRRRDAGLADTLAPSVDSPSTTFAKPEVCPFGRGTVFGDYEIHEEIGRGGMGVVYRARQISLNRPVALKIILESRLASDQSVQRFRAEAAAAAGLNHPDIVPVFEVGETAGQHFFSMGLLEGGSLEDLLAQGPLPPRRAAELVRTVARTVQFTHSRNIVHRDLKPANVLLDAHGNPKLTDFGLAKDIASDAQLTSDGQVMGTPRYMAPEQAAGRAEEVGPLSDVYALGAILYHLVARRPPFAQKNVLDTLNAVINDEPESPRRFNDHVDLDLATICLKCLEKDPARRYPSAAELADDLDRYLSGEPIAARPISRWERTGRWCRRNPAAVWGTLVTVVIMIGAVVYAASGLEREVGSFEETLDQVAQRSLRDTANWVASAAERELREKFRHVQTAAGTPQLQRLLADLVLDETRYARVQSELAEQDAAARDLSPEEWPPLPAGLRPLQSWISADPRWESKGIAASKDTRPGPPLWEYDPDEVAENVLGWWVCGPDGHQLARDPWKASVARDFAFRSYFTGLEADVEESMRPGTNWQPGDGPRLSAVFHTRETDYWVVAISAPVWDNGRFVGVVGTFLRLGSLLERPAEQEAEGTVRYAVLLDPRPDGQLAKVIEHPYHRSTGASPDGRLREEVATTTVTRDEWEAPITEDAFGRPEFGAVEEFGGRWRTAWARVRIPDGFEKELIAVVRESEKLVSEPSRRLRTNLRWLGLAVVGLFVLPLIPLILLLPERRRRG